jgi:hypothetical protein
MNSHMRSKLTQLEQLFTDTREQTLRFYHTVGSICNAVQANPGYYGDYQLLEQALATQKRVIRKARQFASMYTTEQLQALISLQQEDTGFRLHWGHMSYLLSVPTERQRTEFADRAVRNHWDPRTLHAAIQQRFGARGNGGGRPHAVPPTVHAQIRQMSEITRMFLAKREVWNGEEVNFFDNIRNAPPDDLAEVDLVNLRSIETNLQAMATEVGQMATQITECISRVEAVLSERAAASAAAEAERPAQTSRRRNYRAIQLQDQ